ncbi:hypothetical protein PIB30_040176 [Stylosanthes scabra]|uniref:Uncharacterized protein n=1 Tax=Stylosanthes scabra TaxID=79078 RepID=A0ABU6YDD3_9FABA|nr:hypothetical protein [Stylosanthes scabra]
MPRQKAGGLCERDWLSPARSIRRSRAYSWMHISRTVGWPFGRSASRVGLGRGWSPCLVIGPRRSNIQNSCPELRRLGVFEPRKLTSLCVSMSDSRRFPMFHYFASVFTSEKRNVARSVFSKLLGLEASILN